MIKKVKKNLSKAIKETPQSSSSRDKGSMISNSTGDSFQEETKNNQIGEFIFKEVKRTVEDVTIKVSDALFTSPTTISIKIDDIEFSYKKTNAYKNIIYFQCMNRRKGETTNKKCLAKANYDTEKKDLHIINLHNPNCQEATLEKLSINEDYNSQKTEIIQKLSEDQSLSVIKALNVLRDQNTKASPKSKRFPLNYFQVKKILQVFRKDNQLNSQLSFSDPTLLRTIDGAIFRRCYNQVNLIYKSKFFFLTILQDIF